MSDILLNSQIIKKKEKNRKYYLKARERKLVGIKLKPIQRKTMTFKYSDIELVYNLIDAGIEAVSKTFEEDKVTKTYANLLLGKYKYLRNRFKLPKGETNDKNNKTTTNDTKM